MDTICQADGKTQTATLNYELTKMWEMKLRMTPQKTSWLLMGPEQFTRPQNLQTI